MSERDNELRIAREHIDNAYRIANATLNKLVEFEDAVLELLESIPAGASVSTQTVPYLAVVKLRALVEGGK
jgi:hypothetical protein